MPLPLLVKPGLATPVLLQMLRDGQVWEVQVRAYLTGSAGPPGQSPSPESEKQSYAQNSMPSVVPLGLLSQVPAEEFSMLRTELPDGKCPHGGLESQPHPASHAHNHLCKEEGNLQALIRKTELLCFPPDHLIFFIQFLRTQLLKEIK